MYCVLKASNVGEHRIEVIGEFATESEAREFVEESRSNDLASDYEYTVEFPPTRVETVPPQS